MAERSLGWVKQSFVDPRDRFVQIPNYRKLSLWSDLSPGMGPQLSQASLGSCGSNTAAENITFEQKQQGLPAVGASRLFIYWFTRYLMGTVQQDSGVENRSMMKALAAYGYPPESMWPYVDTHAAMVRQPTADVVAAAAKNRIVDYSAVIKSLGQMQGVIDTLHDPFIFGFDVFQQMMSDQASITGIVADPPAHANPVGGHDVLIVGYNGTSGDLPGVENGKVWPRGTFKFRNHWMNSPTQPWGDGGYGYVSFAYGVGPHANDFWVCKSVPGGSLPVPPTPVPVPPDPEPVPPTPTPSVKTFSFAYDPATNLASEVVIK